MRAEQVWQPEPWSGESPEEPLIEAVVEGLREEADRIAKAVASLKEVSGEVRRRMREAGILKSVDEAAAPGRLGSIKYLALDTGFTSPALELIGGRLAVIIRAHVTNASIEGVLPTGRAAIIRSTDKEDLAKPLSKVIEREFIMKILKLKREGRADVDVILVDGELFPRTPPGYVRRRGTAALQRLYDRVVELTDEILQLADETDTALAGITKRTYVSDLRAALGMPNLTINDKALATYVLKPGEWVDLGTYPDIAGHITEYLRRFGSFLSEDDVASLENRVRWIDAVCRSCRHASLVRVAVYKARTPTYFAVATRAELWPSEKVVLENLISYLATLTGVNGVPHPIDLVDGMCRVRPDLLNLIQQRLQAELTAALGDPKLAASVVGLTNPEKMGAAGFR